MRNSDVLADNAVYAGGAFALNDFLGWTDLVFAEAECGLPLSAGSGPPA